MHNASLSWELDCERLVDSSFRDVLSRLPKDLKQAADWVHKSDKSWEWKHFWLENAKLWIRQNDRGQRLGSNPRTFDDDLFEDWNKSEHAEVFLKALNAGKSLKKSSTLALSELAFQLKQIAIRHFGRPGQVDSTYKPQFELGDFDRKPNRIEINLGGKTIEFYSPDIANLKSHTTNIVDALSLIKTYSPDSFLIFCRFSKRIIPIRQKEFVSYSLQSLPGHSFINLYDRDRLDLMDDLLHENGHHHLNHFLILKNPLREDPEQIYYSPWRRTLRPIRGIYHAHLTFYFALKLYHDLTLALLSNQLDFPVPLNRNEKQKILFRYVEEWFMLKYSSQDLVRAIQKGQINRDGEKFLGIVENERKFLGKNITRALNQLDPKEFNMIKKLRRELSENAKLTRQN